MGKRSFDYAIALVEYMKLHAQARGSLRVGIPSTLAREAESRTEDPARLPVNSGFSGARIRKRDGGLVDIRTVAEDLKLPHAYLEKVAQGLKKGGILEGRRGAGGGYCLSNQSANVSVDTLINFYEPRYNFCPVLREVKKNNS